MSSPINSEHIKRPMNGFMIWSNEERQNIRKIYPNAPNSDISIILGQMWNNMSETYKLTYYEKATKLKIQHIKEYPNYKYQPNKTNSCKNSSRNIINTNNFKKTINNKSNNYAFYGELLDRRSFASNQDYLSYIVDNL